MKFILKCCVVWGVLLPQAFGRPACPPGEGACPKISQQVLIQGTPAAYQELYSEFKGQRPECRNQNLKELADFLQNRYMPEECFEEAKGDPPLAAGASNLSCPLGRGQKARDQVTRLGQRVFDLVRLNQKEEDPARTQALSSCTVCPAPAPPSDLTQIARFVKEAVDQSQCSDLKPKQSRRVYSGSGIDTSYKVQAKEGGGYVVPLTLQFEPDRDYDGPVPRRRVSRHYQEQAQECLKKAGLKSWLRTEGTSL